MHKFAAGLELKGNSAQVLNGSADKQIQIQAHTTCECVYLRVCVRVLKYYFWYYDECAAVARSLLRLSLDCLTSEVSVRSVKAKCTVEHVLRFSRCLTPAGSTGCLHVRCLDCYYFAQRETFCFPSKALSAFHNSSKCGAAIHQWGKLN